ncbi:phage major capsid protein [Stakelama tenebrarum]|uniref:Phage major capsid protein n=1 Tax=Stakelama tenebrarum TaxID=2711215 RepID=A0A6G6Y593_9SPHN|nr:phage major capsid protein [Sphingosinithalassobacter tenebrarum]QIG80102.1 phage major capsid protein [Sphingosinithalassobacter tenebrarum]
MKNHSRAALLAAGAAVVRTPRAVCATPRADATDPKEIVAQIQQAFAAFKETNESELKSKVDDTLFGEKMGEINTSITDLTAALEKAQADIAAGKVGGAGDDISAEAREHAGVYNSWFRKGTEPESMRDLEVKAGLTTQSDPDGGYLVPEQMEDTIDRVLGTVSAIRSISRVVSVSASEYKKLVNMGGAGAGWVDEKDERPETATPILRQITINSGELYANPAATQTMLDDARFDIAQWLADEVSIEFAEAEGAAFVNGNGNKKPRGFLQYDTVANDSYAWGKLGFVKTGAAAAFATEDPTDALLDLYYALRSGYRNGATFVTSDAVMGTIRKFKDGQGNYIWAPPTGVDMPATILGKPVVTDDNMPALGAGNFPVAFGNFQRGYLITDRFGVRTLRDPYTNKPFVHFYSTKRVGGGVSNFEAIKLLKCST